MPVVTPHAFVGAYPNGGALGFSPLDIAGLALWLDASDLSTITESSGAVSQWDDKSGNDRHVTQGTAVDQPTTGTRTMNSLNALDFTPDDFLRTPAETILAQPNTIIMVCESDATANAVLIDGHGGAARHYLLNGTKLTGNAGTNLQADPGVLVSTPSVASFIVNGASSVLRINGATRISGDAGASDFGLVTIGALNTEAAGWNGLISEVLVYDSGLSASNYEAVEAYLAVKWGVTLS